MSDACNSSVGNLIERGVAPRPVQVAIADGLAVAAPVFAVERHAVQVDVQVGS